MSYSDSITWTEHKRNKKLLDRFFSSWGESLSKMSPKKWKLRKKRLRMKKDSRKRNR